MRSDDSAAPLPPRQRGPALHCSVHIAGLRLAAWFVLPALLLPAVGLRQRLPQESEGIGRRCRCRAGCGRREAGGSGRTGRQKEAKGAEKPAAAQPAAKPPAASTNDISKWEVADLDAALARKDLLFVPAVVLYGVRNPGDAKRANELDSLVRQVARMKDDPTIPLAFPPNAFSAADKSAAGSSVKPGRANAAAPGKGLRFKIGGK